MKYGAPIRVVPVEVCVCVGTFEPQSIMLWSLETTHSTDSIIDSIFPQPARETAACWCKRMALEMEMEKYSDFPRTLNFQQSWLSECCACLFPARGRVEKDLIERKTIDKYSLLHGKTFPVGLGLKSSSCVWIFAKTISVFNRASCEGEKSGRFRYVMLFGKYDLLLSPPLVDTFIQLRDHTHPDGLLDAGTTNFTSPLWLKTNRKKSKCDQYGSEYLPEIMDSTLGRK